MLVYMFLISLLYVLLTFVMFSMGLFNMDYSNIFNLINLSNKISFSWWLTFVFVLSLFLSSVSLYFVKRRHFNVIYLTPLFLFLILFAFFYPSEPLTYVTIFVAFGAVYAIYYFTFKKKKIYKKVPYVELSLSIIKNLGIVFSLAMAFILTYHAYNMNHFDAYVDQFFYEKTGIWVNASTQDILKEIISEANSQTNNYLKELKNFMNQYVLYTLRDSSCTNVCVNVMNSGFDSLINSTEIAPEAESLSIIQEQKEKIKMLKHYREVILKAYPYLVFVVYYALFSLIFWIVSLISLFWLYILNYLIEEE